MTNHRSGVSILLAATATLTACGGAGSTEVASIPAPPPLPSATPTPAPTPTPTVTTVSSPLPMTPGLTNGTHGTIALVERHSAAPGWTLQSLVPTASPDEVQVSVEPATKTYTVLLSPTVSPYAQTQFNFDGDGIDAHLFGQHVETTTHNPDGSTTTTAHDYSRGGSQLILSPAPGDALHLKFLLELGLSHVSYGAWSGFTISTNSDGTFYSKDDPTFVYFVFGDRTPPADIPISGTASYIGYIGFSDLNGGGFGIPNFSLQADFGSRSISALFDAKPELLVDWDGDEGYTPGFHASGSASIVPAGAFEIPLAGSLTGKSLDPGAADSVMPMTGQLNGAFFGPQASQVGGVVQFTAPNFPGSSTSVAAAFVGTKN